mmetsp:Transcript_35757/g.86510  ORF Transcript_35757/g.86510 Transcript_35757/m.86510 type:complete len:89 (-) Transcript_35757:803-1069(-)
MAAFAMDSFVNKFKPVGLIAIRCILDANDFCLVFLRHSKSFALANLTCHIDRSNFSGSFMSTQSILKIPIAKDLGRSLRHHPYAFETE